MRNVVERVFGITKARFRAMVLGVEHELEDQEGVTHACTVIHNLINKNKRGCIDRIERDAIRDHEAGCTEAQGFIEGVPCEQTTGAKQQRDAIATAMWKSYKAELSRRRRSKVLAQLLENEAEEHMQ